MSDIISLYRAYQKARRFYRRKWMGVAQYHLSAIGERDDIWVFSFFSLIPDPVYKQFLSYRNCELSGIKGIIPAYYDSNPRWIEVNKTTGLCREVRYMGYDWFCGDGKVYKDSLTWHDRQILFDYRKGKGRGFNLIAEDKLSSCYDKGVPSASD
jgi:hypothetical protein